MLIQYVTPGIQWASLSRVCELWGAWEDWGYCGAGKETEEVLVNGGHHCWLVKRRQGGKLPTKFKASFYACFQRIFKVTEVTLFRTVNERIWTQYTVHFREYTSHILWKLFELHTKSVQFWWNKRSVLTEANNPPISFYAQQMPAFVQNSCFILIVCDSSMR